MSSLEKNYIGVIPPQTNKINNIPNFAQNIAFRSLKDSTFAPDSKEKKYETINRLENIINGFEDDFYDGGYLDIEKKLWDNFQNCDLSRMLLVEQLIVAINFKGSNFSGCYFENCIFCNVDFSLCNLEGAIFDGCTFEGSNIDLSDANLNNLTLVGAENKIKNTNGSIITINSDENFDDWETFIREMRENNEIHTNSSREFLNSFELKFNPNFSHRR